MQGLEKRGAPGVELLKDRDVGDSLGSSAGWVWGASVRTSFSEAGLEDCISLCVCVFARACTCTRVHDFGLIKAGQGSG